MVRSRDPRVLERWLPALLAGAEPRSRAFLRAAARLHAAIGELEVAVVAEDGILHAGLLTLVDGDDRWPWWGTGERLAVAARAQSGRSTLTAGASSVGARPEPSAISPSARTHPSLGSASAGVARTRIS